MENKTFGFIGAGRVTRIFLNAFANKGFRPKSIMVYDTSDEVIKNLTLQFSGIKVAHSAKEAAGQDIVFIALHPPAIKDTLEQVKGFVKEGSIWVSLAPKITIEQLTGNLEIRNVVRLIPNATSYNNEGYNPVSFAPGFEQPRGQIMEVLNKLGYTFEVEENKLEAYAIISAMLPTYFWFQWKTLKDIGEKMGLEKGESAEAIYHTVIASLNILFKSGSDPDIITDLIPVKPIGESEESIKNIYYGKLLALFEKIRPA